jgi:putative transcriptional regulator
VALENNLRLIMAQKKIDNISELMNLTGLSRNSINKLWHDDKIETLRLDTLIQICDVLNVRLSDLIQYVPEP